MPQPPNPSDVSPSPDSGRIAPHLERHHGPRLLDRVRHAIRVRHYSIRTEEAYVGWIRRFILFHCNRHPVELGAPDISRFLTALAVERHVSASTQNQALAALLFLYRAQYSATRWRRRRRTRTIRATRTASSRLASRIGNAW